jgi:hypothetical protein
MNAAKKPRRTIREHFEGLIEKVPQIALVPSIDDPAEQHGKAGASACGASGLFSGERLVCGLPVRHGGMHQCGGRYWRPRSGDEIGEPGSEPTA